jgi:hypothetical protein
MQSVPIDADNKTLVFPVLALALDGCKQPSHSIIARIKNEPGM